MKKIFTCERQNKIIFESQRSHRCLQSHIRWSHIRWSHPGFESQRRQKYIPRQKISRGDERVKDLNSENCDNAKNTHLSTFLRLALMFVVVGNPNKVHPLLDETTLATSVGHLNSKLSISDLYNRLALHTWTFLYNIEQSGFTYFQVFSNKLDRFNT